MSVVKDWIEGMPVLAYAAAVGDERALGILVAGGAKVDERGPRGWTALMWAADEGRWACALELLRAGADANAMDGDGDNALLRGAQTGGVGDGLAEFVSSMANAGCDLDQVGSFGLTALMFVAQNNDEKCVESLLNLGCSLEHRDEDGEDALSLAASESCKAMIMAHAEKRKLGFSTPMGPRQGRSAL